MSQHGETPTSSITCQTQEVGSSQEETYGLQNEIVSKCTKIVQQFRAGEVSKPEASMLLFKPSLKGNWKKVPLSQPMEPTWACSTTSNATETVLHNQGDEKCLASSTHLTMLQEKKLDVKLLLLARLSKPTHLNQIMDRTIRRRL